MAYMEKTGGRKHGTQTLHTGSDPKKKKLAKEINFGTGKSNKQSPGFFEMIVNYVKEKLD
jgi:hypothetical protein